MAGEKFSLDESMAIGWGLFVVNFWKFAGLAGLALFVAALPHIASSVAGLNPDWVAYSIIMSILGMVMNVIANMGIINLLVRIVDGKPVSSNDLWTPAGRFWSFVGATLIYVWIVGFGLCFLVVPGIIFGIMFQFYPYFVVEHRLGPIKALKASAAITAGAMWDLFFLGLLLAIIEGLSLFALLIGIIPAVVFCKFTMTHVYKRLLDNTPADQLPFSCETSKPDSALAWDDKMGCDEPVADSARLAKSRADEEGIRLKTPEVKDAQAVDSTEAENDKTDREF